MLTIIMIFLFFIWLGDSDYESSNGGLTGDDWVWVMPICFILDFATMFIYENFLRSAF